MLSWLRELTASGTLLDFALLVLVIEVLVLLRLRRGRPAAPSVSSLIANAGAGGSLILAARLALADAPPDALMGALLLALAFHSWDQWQRW
jgi:hypothetical protein